MLFKMAEQFLTLMADLLSLRKAIRTETNDKYPWTPHCTILIDEPKIIQKAVPVLMKSFQSF